ncbi:hypothetical protein ACEP28_18230 [Pseudomonas aeruginosa]|uniref:hypothetical protein n=1 Tax=Pseudomonas aeruginosa TaxID=287 RepID=UPI00129870D6|nr:hypothetical protein [Pseudomonas aeruginosa]HDQ4610526.1 hypothetical protein [Pseudomonas aeruginosa]
MFSTPQLVTEEIELIPHPMDTWRAALDALIACAPGDISDIAWHLADAHQSSLLLVDRTVASPGAERLIDRLMLISAGRLLNHRLDREEAQQISSRLLERAQRRIAARQPSLDATPATPHQVAYQSAYPGHQQGRPGPGRDQAPGDGPGQQTPSASTHQEPGDRG